MHSLLKCNIVGVAAQFLKVDIDNEDVGAVVNAAKVSAVVSTPSCLNK